MVIYDCAIVGSGPAGLTAAIYLKMSGKNVVLFSGAMPGGLLTKTQEVENYLGVSGLTGLQLTDKFIEHAKHFTDIIYNTVTQIVDHQTHFDIITDGTKVSAKYVILACGSTPTKLNIPNEDVPGVSYCATCDGFFYKNQVVAVVGGGNSAFEEAIYLSGVAQKVYLIHRSDQFRAFQSNINIVKKKPNIEIITNCTVDRCIDMDKALESIELNNTKTGEKTSLKVTGLFVAIGYTVNIDLIKIDKKDGYIVVNDHYQTSNPRIFACGDCIHTPRVRYKQACISSAEGCICALEISKLLSETNA